MTAEKIDDRHLEKQLGQYASSPGYRDSCYAQLTIFSLAVLLIILIMIGFISSTIKVTWLRYWLLAIISHGSKSWLGTNV